MGFLYGEPCVTKIPHGCPVYVMLPLAAMQAVIGKAGMQVTKAVTLCFAVCVLWEGQYPGKTHHFFW